MVTALAGEAGFETFEETADGVTGYVQTSLFDRAVLDAVLSAFPLPAAISYDVTEAEQRDWNEQWEQEGFAPIVIGTDMLVHDGRHLGASAPGAYRYAIEIDPRMAFGTGTHETTRLMLSALLGTDLTGRRLLDCGCGTGILAIAALKMGAREATAYDIDEWSTDNARHNAVINGVDDRLDVRLGDARVLGEVEGTFDVVAANINRNILLADMPAFERMLSDSGLLLLSGFYTADIPMLREKAESLGLTVTDEHGDHGWACMHIRRQPA